MADQKINELPTKTSPAAGDKALMSGAAEEYLIDYDQLANAILNKLTSKTFSLDQGTKTLVAALNELNSKMDNIGDGLYFRYYSIDATSFTGSTAEKINQSVEKTTTNMKGIYLINIYTGSMWIAMAQNYSSNYASYIAFSYWTLGDDSAQPLLGFKRSGEWINKLVAIDPIS